jgi:hypothetical protein
VGPTSERELREPAGLRFSEARCAVASTQADELVAHATQLVGAARAHLDRYPFRVTEGRAALALLDEAAACTTQAGSDASDLETRSRTLRIRLQADFRDRVLRVERALVDDRPSRVRADVDALVALLDGEDHAFARRMRNLRAELADGSSR